MSKRADEYGTATPTTGDTMLGIDISDLTDSAAGTVKQFPFTDFQPRDSDLTALAALTTTAFGRALLELADAAALRTAGGLGDLAVLSAVTASLIFDASANGRSLITAADYSAMRTLLGLVIGTNVQAQDAELAALAGLTSAADKGVQFTGAGTAGTFDLTAAGKALLDDATAAAQRETLFGAATAITGGGTLALGGFTGTVPESMTFAGRNVANVFSAAQAVTLEDAATNTTVTLATLGHNSSGTPAASFGARLLMQLESTTTADQDAAAISAIWTTATHASRTSALIFSTVNNAGALAEMMRIHGGSNVVFPSASGIAFGTPGAVSASVTVVSSFLRFQGVTGVGLSFYTNNAERGRWLSGGTGNLGVGTIAPGTQLHTLTADAVTAAVTNVFTVGHNSSGTPAAGFGVGVLTQLESTTTEDTTAADDLTTWVVATHASRTARRVFSVYDTAAREVIRMEASGTAPMAGFLGAPAIARQTVAADATDLATAITLVNDIKAKLSAAASGFGLFT